MLGAFDGPGQNNLAFAGGSDDTLGHTAGIAIDGDVLACDATGSDDTLGLQHTAGNAISCPGFTLYTSSDADACAEEASGEVAGPGQHF